jgi:hypothetical protein
MYLGTKHMVTGFDHILFLLGVVFFPCRMKDAVNMIMVALGVILTGHQIAGYIAPA